MKKPSSKLAVTARLALGLIFLVFGLNGLFAFFPTPPMPPEGGAFLGALAATGYLMPLLAITQALAGALLLLGVFVPLALVLLAPVLINIIAFHLFLAPGNFVVVGLVVAAELYLAWRHRAAFAPLVAPPLLP
jgi:putative oxidoreductase